ncbi:MAG: hypothetical protein ABH859_08295 [Pseudomonadota bacterium]
MGRLNLLLAISSLIGLGLSTTGCGGCNPAQASATRENNHNNQTPEPEPEAFPDLPKDRYISNQALQSLFYFNNNVTQLEQRGGLFSSETVAMLPPTSFPIRVNLLCVQPGYEQARSLSAEAVGYLNGDNCRAFEDPDRLRTFPTELNQTLGFFENIDSRIISILHYFNGLYAYTATRPYATNMRETLRASMETVRGRSFNSRREAALWMFEENARILALDDPNLYNMSLVRCAYSNEDNIISNTRMRDIILRAVEVQSQEPIGALLFSMALMLGEEASLQEFRGLIRACLALSMGSRIVDETFGGSIYQEIQDRTIGNNEIQTDWCAEVDQSNSDNRLSELVQLITAHREESYRDGRRPLASITPELQDISGNDDIYAFLQAYTLETARRNYPNLD